MLAYKAIYRFEEGGVHAEVVDFPGVVSCGADLANARYMIRSALVDVAESQLLHGRRLPRPNPDTETGDADHVEPVVLELRSGRCVGATSVASRGELVRHLLRMVAEFRASSEDGKDGFLPAFLETMAAWLADCPGSYHNLKLPIDADRPSWQLFADALSAAVVYE